MDARKTFMEDEGKDDGLGPVYNATSCVACHQNPITGGSSQIVEIRAGKRTFDPADPNPHKVRLEEPPVGGDFPEDHLMKEGSGVSSRGHVMSFMDLFRGPRCFRPRPLRQHVWPARRGARLANSFPDVQRNSPACHVGRDPWSKLMVQFRPPHPGPGYPAPASAVCRAEERPPAGQVQHGPLNRLILCPLTSLSPRQS